MSQNPQVQRLIQAIEHFSSRTKGSEDVPKDVHSAIEALHKVLNLPAPGRNTPGARAAHSVAPGTRGTGENFAKAAVGVDGPSPGQREARSLSDEIRQAAESISSNNASEPS